MWLIYVEHGKCGMEIAFLMLIGSMACFMHAIFPFIFEDTATNICNKIIKSHLKKKQYYFDFLSWLYKTCKFLLVNLYTWYN